ncbi:hypothetical protein EV424DRAFT_1455148 [Suillus variegatus]|nr:hypothetical protein EV424DRAFT_1455148 [Suillus variegatus]
METAYVFVIHDNKDLFTCMLLPPIAIDMDGYQNFENWHDEPAVQKWLQELCRTHSIQPSDYNIPLGARFGQAYATARPQQENAAIVALAGAVQEMSKHLVIPPPPPALPAAPPSDFARSLEVLSAATNISDEDKLEMMLLFLKNKDEAIVYLHMNNRLRAPWVQRRLGEMRIHGA